MNEISTSALVLSLEQVGEYDGRVVLYTEVAGKVIARARSLYKMNSKLAGHLQPLTIAQVRLVEKKGVQVVDAVRKVRLIDSMTSPDLAVELLSVAQLISELTQSRQPDNELWQLIIGGKLMSRGLLRVLGFDPEHAECDRCRKNKPSHFLLRDTVYVCSSCFVGGHRRSASSVSFNHDM